MNTIPKPMNIPSGLEELQENYASSFFRDYVKLSINFDGNHLSNNFLDSSYRRHPITPSGNVILSNAQCKMGISAGYFDGLGSFLTIPQSVDWDLGDIWTLSGWTYPTDDTTNTLVSTRGGSGDGWELVYNDQKYGFVGYGLNDTGAVISSSVTHPINRWHHVAMVSTIGFTYLFVDGNPVAQYEGLIFWSSGGHVLRIGETEIYHSTYTGFIDCLDIMKGIARWTDSFTPPRYPLSPSYKVIQEIIKGL